jgi:hypothetical protein
MPGPANKKFFAYYGISLVWLIFVGWGFSCYQSGFSDTEESSGNIVATGQVICRWHSGQDNFVPEQKAMNLLPGETVNRVAQAEKIGEGELWYRLHAEFPASNPDFCRSLVLQATKEGEDEYQGSLADFAVPWQKATNSRDNWHFQLLLPTGGEVYPGASCQPIFVLECASSLVNNLPSGFVDQDQLINNIQGGVKAEQELVLPLVVQEETNSSTATTTGVNYALPADSDINSTTTPTVSETLPTLESLPVETAVGAPASE